jgi:hypothetical protein
MISIQSMPDPVAAAALASVARHDELQPADDAEADEFDIEAEPDDGCVRHGRSATGEILHYPPPMAEPVTLPAPTPPAEGELRWGLRRALADLDCASGRALNARKSVAAADGMLAEIEAELDDHRAAAHAAAEAAGAALARALADGDVATLPAPATTAVDLAAISLGMRRAEIVAARDLLLADLATAEAAHEGASVAVGQARGAIVNFEVDGMVRRLLVLESQAAAIRSRLMVRSAALAPWPPANARLDASGPQYLSAIAFWQEYDAGLKKSPEFSAQSLLGEHGV